MEHNITSLLLMLAEALAPFLVALASWAAYQGAAWLKLRVKNDKARDGIDLAHRAVSDIVAGSGTAFQEQLSLAAEDGVVTADEMKAIRDASLAAVKVQAGQAAIDALALVTSDVDAYLWTKIKAEAHFTQPLRRLYADARRNSPPAASADE